jgi:hypothetical protein
VPADTTPAEPLALDRDALIAICERAFVPEDRWRDRDSSAAQRQLGECYALLRAGCYVLGTRVERDAIWVTIEYRGFGHFDYDGALDDDRFYLPTPERLDRADGGDWY